MKKCIIAMIALTTALAVQADVVALWENNHLAGTEASTTAGESTSGGSYDANLAAAPVVSRGAGATAASYANSFGFRAGNETSLANAIATDRYITWSVQAASGYQLSTTNMFTRIMSQDQAVNVALFSSVGGFTATDAIDTWNVLDTLTQTVTTRDTDLSGISGLQNTTSAIEFRLYYWGKTSAYAQIGLGTAFKGWGAPEDDLRIDGTLTEVVPEPATIGMLGLGAVVSMLIRRVRG